MKFTLKGIPLSTNHIYKMSCKGKFAQMYMTAEGKKLKQDYQIQARIQKNEPMLTGDIEARAIIYFGDKRKRDLDNHNKLWQDALSGIAFKDDKQIVDLRIRKGYDKENPRIEIVILPA